MQHYEDLFWAMAAIVAASLAGGVLLGRCATVARSLAGVAAISALVVVLVVVLAGRAGLGDIVTLLAVAAFMFSLVIGTAATLVSRKVWRLRRVRRLPPGSA